MNLNRMEDIESNDISSDAYWSTKIMNICDLTMYFSFILYSIIILPPILLTFVDSIIW